MLSVDLVFANTGLFGFPSFFLFSHCRQANLNQPLSVLLDFFHLVPPHFSHFLCFGIVEYNFEAIFTYWAQNFLIVYPPCFCFLTVFGLFPCQANHAPPYFFRLGCVSKLFHWIFSSIRLTISKISISS